MDSSKIESFWFEHEDDYEYEIFSILSIVHASEPASFWRENVVAVTILQRVLARMSRSGGKSYQM